MRLAQLDPSLAVPMPIAENDDERRLACAVIKGLRDDLEAIARGLDRYRITRQCWIWSRPQHADSFAGLIATLEDAIDWLEPDGGYWGWAYWLDSSVICPHATANRLRRDAERLLRRVRELVGERA